MYFEYTVVPVLGWPNCTYSYVKALRTQYFGVHTFYILPGTHHHRSTACSTLYYIILVLSMSVDRFCIPYCYAHLSFNDRAMLKVWLLLIIVMSLVPQGKNPCRVPGISYSFYENWGRQGGGAAFLSRSKCSWESILKYTSRSKSTWWRVRAFYTTIEWTQDAWRGVTMSPKCHLAAGYIHTYIHALVWNYRIPWYMLHCISLKDLIHHQSGAPR